jgi:hypothetical protein
MRPNCVFLYTDRPALAGESSFESSRKDLEADPSTDRLIDSDLEEVIWLAVSCLAKPGTVGLDKSLARQAILRVARLLPETLAELREEWGVAEPAVEGGK